jgi:hypothetical protein
MRITDQSTRLLFRAIILIPSTTLKRDFLQLDEGISPVGGVSDIADKIVQLTNRTLAALGHELYSLRCDIVKLVFK